MRFAARRVVRAPSARNNALHGLRSFSARGMLRAAPIPPCLHHDTQAQSRSYAVDLVRFEAAGQGAVAARNQ
jgi:hypothetical protein